MNTNFTGYNPKMKERARSLRKDQTPEEALLWYRFLHNFPVRFYRQRSIDRYIVDFYCSKAGLVVELDGSQHFTEDGLVYDAIRTDILERYDLEVIRFTNREVTTQFDSVCAAIRNKVEERLRRKGLPELLI